MIDKRLLKKMSETKPYITKQVVMQRFSLLCNIVSVALLANVPSHIFYRAVNEQLLLLTTCGVTLCIALRTVCARKTSLYPHEASCRVCEQLCMRLSKELLEMRGGYIESAPTSELIQPGVEGIDQLETYFGRYLPRFFYSMFAPATLFLILVWMDAKSALVFLLCVPLTPVSIIAVQESVKKLLSKHWGSYTALGDSFLGSLQGPITLKIYQTDE